MDYRFADLKNLNKKKMRDLNSAFIAFSFERLQEHITSALEAVDGEGKFLSDDWVRAEGGGGRTMIIENGKKIIKGGVAFSRVEGEITKLMQEQMGMKGDTFLATGVSIVLHSRHPMHPTMHMNVRYFETDTGECWFGGGIDLTPIYVDIELAKKFHSNLKKVCDHFDESSYDQYKKWADEYFYLPHRQETRGVGGIFFDHWKPLDTDDKRKMFDYCIALGELFPLLYNEQTIEEFDVPNDAQLAWQALRWSRYVEYNLLYDRGTKFGIISNGRTESILLSMPPIAQWRYNYQPIEGSPEFYTLSCLKVGRAWL